MRVAAYARVSSKSKEQLNSYYTQISHYTQYISCVEDWELVDVYADEGISGLRSDNRPEFQRMLADCKAGKIDRILTKTISRFSRNKQHTFSTIHELSEMGVSVYFEENHIDTADLPSTTLFSLLSVLAERESIEISQNARYRIQKTMRRGSYVPVAVPYGYRKKNGVLLTDDSHAPVVRRIFQEFLSGTGTEQIADNLNIDGVPGPRNAAWHGATVRYILSNTSYTGNPLWPKSYTTDTVPFERKPNKGEKEQFTINSAHEPIISCSEYETVQELFRMRNTRFSPRQEKVTPLRNRLVCGACGSSCRGRKANGVVRWNCYNHEKHLCAAMPVAEEAIQQAFINLYNTLSANKESVLHSMRKQLLQVSHQIRLSDEMQRIDTEILDLIDQNAVLQEMRSRKQITEVQVRSHIDGLARKLIRLRTEKRAFIERAEDTVLLDKTEQMISILDDGPECLYQFENELFELLILKVELLDPSRFAFHLLNGLVLPACAGRKEAR